MVEKLSNLGLLEWINEQLNEFEDLGSEFDDGYLLALRDVKARLITTQEEWNNRNIYKE